MTPNVPRAFLPLVYEEAAQEYLRSLPLEHFMESIPQATQRKITVESLDLVHSRRPEVRVFNELLVQYPIRGQRKPGQVVPDNMVVLTDQRIRASGSYDVPLEPVSPFWVLEYVSKSNKRKDYEDSFLKYERDLKVPYYLVFDAEDKKLTLYRHNKRRYVTVKPNAEGRYPIPQLDLEVGLLGDWVRYWYKGKLLPLPADLQRELTRTRRRADEEKRRADQEKQRADEEKGRADQEKGRADEEKGRADQEKQRADELQQRLEASERALAETRARLEPRRP